MSEIDQWDAAIEQLELRLDQHRRDRDSSAPGSELFQGEQADADRVHYQLIAYRTARPVLIRLYGKLVSEVQSNKQHRSKAVDDAGHWTRLATGAGLVGGLLVLIGIGTSAPWGFTVVGIMFLAVCVLAVGAGVAAHRDYPDTGSSVQLSARIEAIRSACRDCSSSDGLDHVRLLVNPPVPGRHVSRLL